MRLLCRVRYVSESAYHAYATGKSYRLSVEKAGFAKQVEDVFHAHCRRYGSRRITAELQARGLAVGRFQVRS